MKGIIDRFEGEYAVIEVEGKTRDVKRDLVELDVSAGDVVICKDGRWYKDHAATVERTRHIKSLMDSVWED